MLASVSLFGFAIVREHTISATESNRINQWPYRQRSLPSLLLAALVCVLDRPFSPCRGETAFRMENKSDPRSIRFATMRAERLSLHLFIATTLLTSVVVTSRELNAQTNAPQISTVAVDPFQVLEDQLRSRLRATSREQRGYINFVVKQVKEGRLDMRLVVGVQRYAIRRRADFPFPFFERALRVEAAKRNIILPGVQTFASTKISPSR